MTRWDLIWKLEVPWGLEKLHLHNCQARLWLYWVGWIALFGAWGWTSHKGAQHVCVSVQCFVQQDFDAETSMPNYHHKESSTFREIDPEMARQTKGSPETRGEKSHKSTEKRQGSVHRQTDVEAVQTSHLWRSTKRNTQEEECLQHHSLKTAHTRNKHARKVLLQPSTKTTILRTLFWRPWISETIRHIVTN